MLTELNWKYLLLSPCTVFNLFLGDMAYEISLEGRFQHKTWWHLPKAYSVYYWIIWNTALACYLGPFYEKKTLIK